MVKLSEWMRDPLDLVAFFKRQSCAAGIGNLDLRAVRSDHQNVTGKLLGVAMQREAKTPTLDARL
jgi:hypothetical protein